MSIQNRSFKLILLLTLFVLAACTGSAEGSPRAWIDFPRDGSTIPAGSAVTVISHASAEEGVAEVLLSVNGEAYRRDSPEEAGASFSAVRQEWFPAEAGLYTLQVRSYDSTGAVSSPYGITVRVVSEVAAVPTATVTAVPTFTPTPVTPTATVTLTPAPPTATFTPAPIPPTATFTPTPVPPTPTFTPVPPTPTFTPIPPTPTATFTPTAPPPPPDTTPPPVPTPMVPADELFLTCRTEQTLAWLPVADDQPGTVRYYVKLERQVMTNQWDPVDTWGPIVGKEISVPVQCGPFYRWAVRAVDEAGNSSDWSAWSRFSVGIN
ncbi:MAG: Ig-like domain-containing protein [Ardenticatenaceae bacterium]|nr:Ig-like domain-containing protein [Ardenticatenaceae bacterium]